MDCGPSCLRMIAEYFGRRYSLESLRQKMYLNREGVSLLDISDAAESIGMHTLAVKIGFDKIFDIDLPAVVPWKQNHFVVVYKVTRRKVYVADPAVGKVTYTHDEFKRNWESFKEDGENKGIALLMEPTPTFFEYEGEETKRSSLGFLFRHVLRYKRFVVQLILGLLVGSILQLLLPFLTQSIVDYGINYQDIHFITLVLVAQLMLFFSATAVNFIRSWILLHVGTRVNISILSDFLIKMMRLPISFFDTKMIGDLLQRIGDHKRIERFLTTTSLNTMFSMVNIVVFSIVLGIFSWKILAVFLGFTFLYIVWVLLFMRKRRELDFKRFDQQAANQSQLIQLINGMQEIKLSNSEKQMRWEWERIQARLFRVNMKGLALGQWQSAGARFFNEFKNIIITFMAAYAVVNGEMTLGMMLAVQYIIGQLNSPVDQLIGFFQMAQDAKISLERIGEIYDIEDEESREDSKITILPYGSGINIVDLDFRYGGPESKLVLDRINLDIPNGKVTAVVGMSGSGKTTLVRQLLKFYKPSSGEIRVGDTRLANLDSHLWRDRCGAVMQDGYIFSDTIARNIAVGQDYVDKERLLKAVKVANIKSFVESLPLSYNTKIGMNGIGLSQGQKQRILIARAVYKNPDYLFFDEATNALDANNEKAIMENLDEWFEGKTVVVVAHRLSTVKNADQIVVLENGKIIERGNHKELTDLRGAYYKLVKNQLELGA